MILELIGVAAPFFTTTVWLALGFVLLGCAWLAKRRGTRRYIVVPAVARIPYWLGYLIGSAFSFVVAYPQAAQYIEQWTAIAEVDEPTSQGQWQYKPFQNQWQTGLNDFINGTCKLNSLDQVKTVLDQNRATGNYTIHVWCKVGTNLHPDFKFDMDRSPMSQQRFSEIRKEVSNGKLVLAGLYIDINGRRFPMWIAQYGDSKPSQ